MEIKTIYCDLPATVKAFTVCKDGFYTIVLNQNLNHEQNMLSYAHEYAHIKNGDFEKKCSADMLELFAHNML